MRAWLKRFNRLRWLAHEDDERAHASHDVPHIPAGEFELYAQRIDAKQFSPHEVAMLMTANPWFAQWYKAFRNE